MSIESPARIAPLTGRKHLSRYRQKLQKPSVPERLLASMRTCLERGENPASLLSVERLTSEAGISRGTFYDHYKDVGDLVLHLMEMVTLEIIQGAGAWLAYSASPQQQDFDKGFHGMATVFRKHRAVIAAFNILALNDPLVGQHYDAMVESFCERFRYSVETAQKQGLLVAGADREVADAISWIIVMFFSRFGLVRKDEDFKTLERSLMHICMSALFSKS